MKKTLPTDAGLMFLTCELIRNEDGGKLSLLGVFAGGDILVKDAGSQGILPSLSFLFSFTDGLGEFAAKFGLLAPDEKEILASEEQTVDKKLDQNMNMAFQLMPFNFTLGTYTAYVVLDGNRFERHFSVKSQDQ